MPASNPSLRGSEPGPTWAVVVPAYNSAGHIGEALASLRDQTEPADQIIVCDDGSDDDLEAAITPFRSSVTLIRQPNRGPSAARNAGAARATTDWLLFLDADDWLDADFLQRLRETSRSHPEADIIATDAEGFDESRRTLYRQYERTRFPVEQQRAALLADNFLLTGISVRRSRFEEVGGFDEGLRHSEDYDCWLRLALTGSTMLLAEGTTLHRRHHGQNQSSDRPAMVGARINILRRAMRHPSLSDHERAVAQRSLRDNKRSFNRLSARGLVAAWVEESGPIAARSSRRDALRLLRASGLTRRQRLLLALGVVAPALPAVLVSLARSTRQLG